MTPRESLIRWRLVLVADAEQGLGCGLGGEDARREDGEPGLLERAPIGALRREGKPQLAVPRALERTIDARLRRRELGAAAR